MPPPQRSRGCRASRAAGLPIHGPRSVAALPPAADRQAVPGRAAHVSALRRRSPHAPKPSSTIGIRRAHRLRNHHHALNWGPLSDHKLENAIDVWVDRYDPGALRHTRAHAQDRGVHVGSRYDGAGITGITGRLYATDAALLDRRLKEMAHGVCDDDPRTISQRRADAMGALAAGSDRLACQCGSPECPSAADDGRAGSVVIHVVTDVDPNHHCSGSGDVGCRRGRQ